MEGRPTYSDFPKPLLGCCVPKQRENSINDPVRVVDFEELVDDGQELLVGVL